MTAEIIASHHLINRANQFIIPQDNNANDKEKHTMVCIIQSESSDEKLCGNFKLFEIFYNILPFF